MRLIPIDAPRSPSQWAIDLLAFSTDGKYFFAKDRLVMLDADLILERLSNQALFGELAEMSEDQRKQYLID